jgi:hypothetical protein
MKYLFLVGALLSVSVVKAQIMFMPTANPAGISGAFNLTAAAVSVAGFTNLHATSFASAAQATDANTVTLACVPAKWQQFSSSTGTNATGATGGSRSGLFPQTVAVNVAWTGNISLCDTVAHTTDTSQGSCLRLYGLPAGTYDIELYGALPYSFYSAPSNTTRYGVTFGSGALNFSYAFNPNFSPGVTGSAGTYNTWEVGPGTSFVSSGSFTGTITSGQTINIFVGSGIQGAGAVGGQYEAICGVYYHKH